MLLIIALFVIAVLGVLFIGGKSSEVMDEYCRLECWDEKVSRINHCC